MHAQFPAGLNQPPEQTGQDARCWHCSVADGSTHTQKRTVRRQHEPAGRVGLGHRPQATPDHHRKLGVGLWRLRVSPGHSGPAARAQSCLTRAGHRPVVWSHEIPDSGISHWNTGSSPRSGTEAGDIPPVFAVLEHAAGDFTTPGKNPLLEYSSPPSDTFRISSVKKPSAVACTLQGYALVSRDIHIVTGIVCAYGPRTLQAATHSSTLTFTGPKSRREPGPEVQLARCQTHSIRPYVIRSYAWRR